MIASKPFILYSIPKSRTTQALLQGNKIKPAWDQVTSFLLNCTTTTALSPVNIELSAYEACRDDKHPEITKKFITELKKEFGKGKTEPIAEGYPNFITWELEKKDLNRALNYLLAGQPWPRFTFGPVELLTTYDFRLIEPSTKKELPGQEYSSDLMVWLGRKCSANTSLYFPFEKPTKGFTGYLNKIEKYLPFKLEQKYLRLGRPNKGRTANTYSKL
ncbi:MAG: hypothetical protein Q8941_12305 [Bacteroidota bacterium]|nr:hypothetical protein [Bacteroidota bacterium]